MRTALSMILASGLIVLSGCDQNKKEDGEKITIRDKDNHVTVSGNGQHVTVHASDGNAQVDINTNGVNVTAKLPSFVAIYPGAKVATSAIGTDKDGAGGTLVMETKASPADVMGFYKQKALASGFKETMNMDMSGTLMFTGQSGDDTIHVLVSKADEGTHAQVTWSGK